MASAARRYTVDEILEYLDDNFDIPDDGVNSDIEGLDEEDFDEENDLLPEVPDFLDEDDEDINLADVDIVENGENYFYCVYNSVFQSKHFICIMDVNFLVLLDCVTCHPA